MSHFTVTAVVNGKTTNLKDIMAPFNEQDEKYFTPHDVTEENLADYEKYKTDEDFLKEHPDASLKSFLDWWNGKISVQKDSTAHLRAKAERRGHAVFDGDTLIEVVSYWNDNAKYDYYVEGGRWGENFGFVFKDKNFDPNVNGVRVGDLDIDAMVAKVEDEARADYKSVISFIGHIPHVDLTWDDVCNIGKNWKDPLREEAEELYRSQPDCVLYEKYKKQNNLFFGKIADYCCTEEEYVAKATLNYYSLVDESGWYSKGEMGWFGCSDDKMTNAEWKKAQIEFFKRNLAENPDAEVIMLDCHI